MRTTENIPRGLVDTVADNPAFEPLLRRYGGPIALRIQNFKENPITNYLYHRFGLYQHSSGLRIPCFIQLFAHRHEKVVRLHMYDQSWNLQAELNSMLSIRERPC